MKCNDNLEMKGKIIQRIIENDKIIKEYKFNNLIVNSGRNLIRNYLNGSVTNGLSYLALGIGNNTPTVTDTSLNNEIFRIKINLTNIDNDQEIKTYTFIPSSSNISQPVTELGLFMGNATSSLNTGTLFSRQLFPVQISKSSTQSLYIEWDITI